MNRIYVKFGKKKKKEDYGPESHHAVAFKNVVKRKKMFPLHTYYNY